ncbi:MAG: prolyl oligopeptidase family serine peptidase [Anaerolineales bacterium]
MTFAYPHSPTVDQTDDYHGTLVPDPYRWLEDPDSPATRAWVEAQNALTFDYLRRIPAREKIQKRLTELWDYEKAWAPVTRGGRYFQLRNTGLQNQDVLFVMDKLGGEARVLLDPNTLSEDGTVALNTWEISPDGKWLAYAVSASGSDWVQWRVREVATGQDLPDRLEWSKFSGAAWRKDGTGFYYSRYDAPPPGQDYTGANYFQKLYFHRLGEPQANDVLLYERPDQKEWGFSGQVTDDGRYLILTVWTGTDVRNMLFYIDLASDTSEVVELINRLEATYEFIGNDGPIFYLRTNLDAPRSKLIALDTTCPTDAPQTIIPESADTLEGVKMIHNEFIAVTLHDAHHRLLRYDLEGAERGEVPLPGLGSIPSVGNFFNLTGERMGDEMFYGFWSFVHPPAIYRYDFRAETSECVFMPPVGAEMEGYVTRQVFVPSKDGAASIPMFLTHRKDLVFDGNVPTLLYGYGGFNIALVPAFAAKYLVWLEMGGGLAWANLRGGGEYGETWHKAGTLHAKQNVFDDFIACAEYLIREGITSTPKLAIQGRSNGGLLVGACLTQRPDLFGAALPAVGVMDMLRFHKFTIGWAWVSDYGSSEDPEQFNTLYAYSPLHNIRPGTVYPPTLITTADHDDRVVPAHSFKFVAALQAAQAGEAPILIRIQTKGGHGMGLPTAFQIEEWADVWAFLVEALGMEE